MNICASRRLCGPVYINMTRTNRPSARFYRTCDRLACPHRLTTPRPAHLSVPPQMLRSSFSSISRGLVYINIPGRTCLRELFIEYEQVTAWVARFSSNKLEASYHVLSAAAWTGWLNVHLNLLWIYTALLTPMIYTFCYGKVWRIARQLLESS